ncbi:MAG: GNAT family N-acetyltransferase [Lachnospiraceae bacterium]|nr:GNAT family N-acetyltransferase [Lachnospiraceae bacterium]
MFEFEIELKLADCPKQVAAIVRETIQKVYPHYYPSGAVQFFLDLHSETRIEEVMCSEEIYLAVIQGSIIGTGSIRKNEICRLFILPEYQGMGYGSRLMDLLEGRILENYPKIHVDASFPAESMYLKRGYQFLSYEKIKTENGDFLCYHTMEKERGRNLSV